MKQLGVRRAKRLREQGTHAETALWFQLRNRRLAGAKFRRQHPIGPYIVDFVCLEQKLIIEVDGGQHSINAAADERRTAALKEFGYRVIRYWNNDVLANMNGVLESLLLELGKK